MLYWLKKTAVTIVAALTFGIVAPPSSHVPTSTNKSDSSKPNSVEGKFGETTSEVSTEVEVVEEKEDEKHTNPFASLSWQEVATSVSAPDELREQLPVYTISQAEKRGFEKFGPTIADQVGNEYRDQILPKVGQVMQTVAADLDDESLRNLEIFSEPSPGTGERLFHVMNKKNDKDVVRFHVRRDHPPQDGYWFNFHYHLPKDQFQVHYELGKIFWDKDTPPQWRA